MAYSREIEKLERQFNENPRRFAAPFADALRKSDEVARALEVIQVGLELNPEYIPGSVILGRCHLDLGDDNAAEAAFSRVLDLDNENVIALKSLADITERQGRQDEAVRFLKYLLDVDRSNDEARQQLARLQGTTTPAVQPAKVAAAESSSVPPADQPAPAPSFGAPPAEEFDSEPAAPEASLEPTALWEPPTLEAAPLSDWVETTAVESGSQAEPTPSLLEEPAPTGGIRPLEGFESTETLLEPMPDGPGEFFIEREEEIILSAGAGAEYQVANDSESLLAPPPEPPPAPSREEPPASSRIAEELSRAESEAPAPPAEVPAASPPAAGEEASFEWAMDHSEEREFVPAPPPHSGAHPPDSFDDAIEGIAPVVEPPAGVVARSDADEDAPEAAASDAAPVLMVTESMAELYAAQGHPGEALGVYRILFDRNPGNERLRVRIQELESALAAKVAADAAPSFAASVTGGTSVGAFLGALLGARPAAVDLPEAPPAAEAPVMASTAGEAGEEALAAGAPTRPAEDRLSLGAIFGEDSSPVPPAEAAAGRPEGGSGFSFDEFFGSGEPASAGRTSSGSARAARPAEDDDLDQFHSWLQSLKR